MTDEQIAFMVNRFLSWRLPQEFRPDGGISYTRPHYDPDIDATPSGTDLFDARQAEAMVRHMIEGIPKPVSDDWTIKSGKHAKGGLHMNFCPICGENLRGLFEHVFADRDAAAATTT